MPGIEKWLVSKYLVNANAVLCEYHLVDINFSRKFHDVVKKDCLRNVVRSATTEILQQNIILFYDGASSVMKKWFDDEVLKYITQYAACFRRQSMCLAYTSGTYLQLL